MTKLSIAALAAITIAFPVAADEVWKTDIGDVVYERELESGDAVWSYPAEDGTRGLAYFQGLAGVYEDRTSFTGIWIEANIESHDRGCAVSLFDPETGEARNNWGRINLVFTEPDFPGGWVAIRGSCFDQPHAFLVGKPVVGDQ